jgi:predicted transcriptional regulator
MIQTQSKKNRINLADYPYEKDIKNRLLMADLSVFEVEVIHEILHSSLKIEIDQLAKALDSSAKKLEPVLAKLAKMKLLKQNENNIEINKDMRKYFESEILKYDDDFKADMEFLRGLLNKVPIHVLPQWYPISKTSDDIFSSIIEKFLHTPKIYQRYLDDLVFDEPILREIMNDVFASPELKVQCKTLLKKYSLTREKLEENLLHLEFNLACCLSYSMVGDTWEEVITPFYEWKKYLQFERDTVPVAIKEVESIVRTHPEDFGFVQDMTRLLLGAQDKKITLVNRKLTNKDAKEFLPEIIDEQMPPNYIQNILDILLKMKFAEIKNDVFVPHDSANDWIKKPLLEQAMLLYRFSGSHIQDKDIRATEKSLKKVLRTGWVYFDDFLKGFTAPIGKTEPVSLESTGKRWRYVLPKYTKEDIAMVKSTIFDRLFQCGMVCTGTHHNKPCFMVTPFGKNTLD